MSDDLYCRRCIDRGKALARKDAALRMAVEALVACEANECTRDGAATALAACHAELEGTK